MPHHGCNDTYNAGLKWIGQHLQLLSTLALSCVINFPSITGLGLPDSFIRKLKLGATWWNRLLNYSRCCSVIISFLSPWVAKAEITFTYSKEEALKLQNNAVAIKCTNNFQIIHYPDIKTSTNYFQLQLQQTNGNRNAVEMGMWQLLKYDNSWCNSPNSGVCYCHLYNTSQ